MLRSNLARASSPLLGFVAVVSSLLLSSGCVCPKVATGPPAKLWLEAEKTDPNEKKDPNGFLLNPVFRGGSSQAVEPRNCPTYEACGATGQTLPSPKKDWIPLLCRDARPGREHAHAGHWNYGLATFIGRVAWDAYSPDDDYGLTLLVGSSPAGSILTCGSKGGVHVEFRACETVNHFTTSWWKELREAVERGQRDQTAWDALGKKEGLEAVLVGLVGVDMVHCFATELHPVYGLAVRVGGDPGKEEHWALFARLVGGEGECADGNVAPALDIAPRGRLVLPLPWRRDVRGNLLPPPTLGRGTALLATKGSDVRNEDEVQIVPTADRGWLAVSIPIAPLAAGDEDAKAWTRVSGELVLRYESSGPTKVVSSAQREMAPRIVADRTAYFQEISSRGDTEEQLLASLKKLEGTDRERALEALYQSVKRANGGPNDERPLAVRILQPTAAAAPLAQRADVAKQPAVKTLPNPWYMDPE